MNLETHQQLHADRDLLELRHLQPLARRLVVGSVCLIAGHEISRIATIGPSSTRLNRASRSARVRASAIAFS